MKVIAEGHGVSELEAAQRPGTKQAYLPTSHLVDRARLIESSISLAEHSALQAAWKPVQPQVAEIGEVRQCVQGQVVGMLHGVAFELLAGAELQFESVKFQLGARMQPSVRKSRLGLPFREAPAHEHQSACRAALDSGIHNRADTFLDEELGNAQRFVGITALAAQEKKHARLIPVSAAHFSSGQSAAEAIEITVVARPPHLVALANLTRHRKGDDLVGRTDKLRVGFVIRVEGSAGRKVGRKSRGRARRQKCKNTHNSRVASFFSIAMLQ